MFKLDKSKKVIAATFIVTALTLPTLGCSNIKSDTLTEINNGVYTDYHYLYSSRHVTDIKSGAYELIYMIEQTDTEKSFILTSEQVDEIIESGKQEIIYQVGDSEIMLPVNSLKEYKRIYEEDQAQTKTVSGTLAATALTFSAIGIALRIKRALTKDNENESLFKEDEDESELLRTSKSKRR